MSRSLLKRVDSIEPMINSMTGNVEPTVYGVIDRVDNIGGELVPHVIRKWKGTIGHMIETDEDPTIFVIEKFERALLIHKKYKCFPGSRASTKTRFAQNTQVSEVHTAGSKIYVLRERMNSIKESIYSGIESTIKKSGLSGFLPVPSKWEIRNANGGKFVFGGMQNIIDMKGAADFKRFLMEEAEKTKQSTIDTLGPTLRDVEGAELWYVWNVASSQDPMSKEFIVPYQADLDKKGYYEDEHHLIIFTTHEDNPWLMHDESLRLELEKDKSKLAKGIMSQSRFDNIWWGKFNDDIANSVIREDWFKACIDAHKVLGFEGKGAKVVGGDPSDVGTDPFGYVARHGVVVQSIDEIMGDNGNRKMDEACKMAIQYGADSFGYDADGLGATLRDNVNTAFSNKRTNIYAYKGSSEIWFPEAQFKSETAQLTNTRKGIKNKEVLFNKKAQNTINIAERIYKTWECVTARKAGDNKFVDPDDLISFDSEMIKPEMLEKLKAEACKTPTKAASTVKFYTKAELRKGIQLPDGNRIVIPSPNLFDALVLSFDNACIINHIDTRTAIPRPIPVMGRR